MTPFKIENNPNITFHLTLLNTFETSSLPQGHFLHQNNWISFVFCVGTSILLMEKSKYGLNNLLVLRNINVALPHSLSLIFEFVMFKRIYACLRLS